MNRTERRVEDELRQVAVDTLVADDGRRADDLANGLHIPREAVDALLKKNRWDLGLTCKILDQLGLEVKVITA